VNRCAFFRQDWLPVRAVLQVGYPLWPQSEGVPGDPGCWGCDLRDCQALQPSWPAPAPEGLLTLDVSQDLPLSLSGGA
jgi:hypothetical protein